MMYAYRTPGVYFEWLDAAQPPQIKRTDVAGFVGIARRCDTAFARRLVWAKWLQRGLLIPIFQNALVTLISRHEAVWRLVFARTR